MKILHFLHGAATVHRAVAALFFIFLAVAHHSVMARGHWVFSVDGGWEHGFRMSESQKVAYFDYFVKPPNLLFQRSGYDTKLFSNTRLVDAEGWGSRFALDRAWMLGDGGWAASVGVTIGFSRVNATYAFERWARYDGINPYTGGTGGPPIRGGFAERRIRHDALAPGFRVRLSRIGGRIRPWTEWGMGVQQIRFEEFDIHEAWASPGMHPISIHGPLLTTREYGLRREHTFHGWAGIGFAVDLADGWELTAGMLFNYLTGYRIRAVYETGTPTDIDGGGVIITYGFPVENVIYRRLSLGLSRRW